MEYEKLTLIAEFIAKIIPPPKKNNKSISVFKVGLVYNYSKVRHVNNKVQEKSLFCDIDISGLLSDIFAADHQ